MKPALRILGPVLFAVGSLTAQKTGGSAPPAGTGIGSGPSTGNVGGIPGTPSQPVQTANPPDQTVQMPIFLSGRVLMDDGSPPAASIAIQRLCSDSPRTVAFTNAKGQFNFQWGVTTGIVPDASEATSGFGMRGGEDAGMGGARGNQMGNGSSTLPLMGCELMANAPGFRSEHLNLTNHRASDNPELGVIVLHRLAAVEGTSVSATSLNAPKEARKAWEKGSRLLHKAKGAEAEKELQRAVEIYPKYANAWLDLGRARMQQRSVDGAREAFLKAIEADGKLVDAYVESGELAANRQDWPEAAKYLDRALQLDPVDYPRLWFEDAVADYNTQNYDRAEKNAREALKLAAGNRDARANQVLGLILINKRDYAGAGAALREYVKLSPNAKDLDQVRVQLQEIDSRLPAKQP